MCWRNLEYQKQAIPNIEEKRSYLRVRLKAVPMNSKGEINMSSAIIEGLELNSQTYTDPEKLSKGLSDFL